MHNHKRILSVIMVFIMIFGMLTSASADPSSWAEGFVKSMLMEDLSSEALLDSNLMQQSITREEFAELTVRLYAKANNIEIEDIPRWNPFADTDNPMVARAYNIGIVSGTGTDSKNRKLFSPSNRVTRQEIAVMLIKELNILGKNVTPSYTKSFVDNELIDSWAYDAVAFATESNIISGVGSNMVAPLANATREEAMVIVNKIAVKYAYINNEATKSKFTYSNASKISGFWLPNDDATKLRATQTPTGIKYVISHLVDSYAPDIKGQQTDMINILVNSDAVSYPALVALRRIVLESYDPIAKKYLNNETVYVSLNSGTMSQSAPSKPYMKVSVDTEITLEYIQ